METVTWRQLLTACMEIHKESLADIISNTMTDEDMDKEFDPGWGVSEGCPFTVWTKKRVYFPAVYDGSEWVASVSRNPNKYSTNHVGGG
ncbi:hypothetical protein ACFLQL_00750 [Verrucomicrobiota bacterium]